MELVQIHTMEPLTPAGIGATLAAALPASLLDPKGGLSVHVSGPWRPADRWEGGVERLVWTATFTSPRARFLKPDADATLIRRGLARPDHPIHPAEALARQVGGALLVHWSDAWQLVSVAVYRDRRLRWSLLLQGAHGGREADAPDGPTIEETPDRYTADTGDLSPPPPVSRMVRCDGHSVIVEAPVRWVPEGDRTGVLLAGLDRFLTEPLSLSGTEQLTLPDQLAEADLPPGEPTWLARDGAWLFGARAPAAPPPGRATGSGGRP